MMKIVAVTNDGQRHYIELTAFEKNALRAKDDVWITSDENNHVSVRHINWWYIEEE